MKILLISRFNVPNLGDLVISDTLYSLISRYGKTDKYNLFGEPFNFVNLNNIETNGYSLKYKLFRILKKYRLEKLITAYGLLKTKIKSKNSKTTSYEEVVDSYDLIILGGGNMLMTLDDNNSTINRLDNYVDIAIKKGKKIFAMDIGIGPFFNDSDKELAIEVLNKCDYVTFRDDSSYKLFCENGGNSDTSDVSVDPVFLANFDYEKEPTSDNAIQVGVNIIDSRLIGHDEKEYKKKLNGYASIVNKLLNNNIKVSLFITSKEDQAALDDTFRLIRDKRNVEKIEINGINQLIKLYSNMDLLLGTRMHSMIIAYVMGVPLVGLSWQTKVTSFFNVIDEAESCFDFKEFEKNHSLIYKTIQNKIYNSKSIIESMKKKLETIKEKAKTSEKVLEKYARELR
ncbi:MAG: polysaccharide pyruvyl transferase family protein [Desemzia incerta]|uniref:polysaccharide pyruvyl transferase family protein n=1 Tax=Desemzia incerta TaxID=82801 RepID=UPI00331589C8